MEPNQQQIGLKKEHSELEEKILARVKSGIKKMLVSSAVNNCPVIISYTNGGSASISAKALLYIDLKGESQS